MSSAATEPEFCSPWEEAEAEEESVEFWARLTEEDE